MATTDRWTVAYVLLAGAFVLIGVFFVGRELVKGMSESPPSGEFARVYREVVGLRQFDEVDSRFSGNAVNRFFYARRRTDDADEVDRIRDSLRGIGWHSVREQRAETRVNVDLCRNRMIAGVEGRIDRDGMVEIIASFGWAAGSQRSLPPVCRSHP